MLALRQSRIEKELQFWMLGTLLFVQERGQKGVSLTSKEEIRKNEKSFAKDRWNDV